MSETAVPTNIKLSPAQLAFLIECASNESGGSAVSWYPPVIRLLAIGYIRPGRSSSSWLITDAGREALTKITDRPAGSSRKNRMTFQEAITAQAIHSGLAVPKASNLDVPELRLAKMIEKGWVEPGGQSLTQAGRDAAAAFGEREGWHPARIANIRFNEHKAG